MTTISARDCDPEVSGARRAASTSPALIIDRGEPAFVLFSTEHHRRLGDDRTIADWLQRNDGCQSTS